MLLKWSRVVGKIMHTSRSDRSATRGQTTKEVTAIILNFLTIGVAGDQTTPGGGQTILEQRLMVFLATSGGDQTARACLGRPKQLLQPKFLQGISMIQILTD
jgi:hypothetical protein